MTMTKSLPAERAAVVKCDQEIKAVAVIERNLVVNLHVSTALAII